MASEIEMRQQYQREILSFDEKISLSKMEEAKATHRTRELEYQKSRFTLDTFMQNAKEEKPV